MNESAIKTIDQLLMYSPLLMLAALLLTEGFLGNRWAERLRYTADPVEQDEVRRDMGVAFWRRIRWYVVIEAAFTLLVLAARFALLSNC